VGSASDAGIEATTTTSSAGAAASGAVGGGAGSGAAESTGTDGVGSTGAIDVLIESPAGRPAPRAPVRITGGKAPVSATSADDGHVRATLSTGRYTLEIDPTCSDTMQVLTSGRGTLAVASGQTANGTLRVEWRHRFGPGGKTTTKAVDPGEDRGRRWQVGRHFEVRFLLVDRCNDDAPAPGGALGSFRLEPGPSLAIDRQPSAATAEGKQAVVVHCTEAADELSLTVRDAAQPEDARDLFDRAALDDSPPSCEP
jgi:hypothetical protein